MDSARAIASVVRVGALGASSTFNVVPRTENFEPETSKMAPPVMSLGSERKKRGRPRKYKPDESTSMVFSPVPLLSSATHASGKSYVEEKKASVARPINSEKKHRKKVGTGKLDDLVDCCTGSSFTPHVITVNTGEDISTKIMEFSLQGPRTVCVISGTGTVSNVTIRHPYSSGGTLTYKGLFDIISFSGSYTPTEMADAKFGRSGMMAISLSGADGRIIGGLIAGLTTAASPVKVFVASFLLSSSHALKPKKRKTETAVTMDASSAQNGGATSETPTNWSSERSKKSTAEINISLQG